MAFRRETYYAALFERLQAKVPDVVTWSRSFIHFSRLPAASQPACIMLASNQGSAMETRVPTVWTLGAVVVLWVRSTGQKDVLDTVLNDLVDLVVSALNKDADEALGGQLDPFRTSLGGLIQKIEIAGDIRFNQEEGAAEASVLIPIDMVVLGDNPAA